MPGYKLIGRLRMPCKWRCHGAQTNNPIIGIRYYHPVSGCAFSGLKGELVHPTQLYAPFLLFCRNFFAYPWIKEMCISPYWAGFIPDIDKPCRFVEEAYRGEVQTPNIKSLTFTVGSNRICNCWDLNDVIQIELSY